MKVDPVNITNYELDDEQLQVVLLFWVAVAGKTAKTTSNLLESLLDQLAKMCGRRLSPFSMIRKIDKQQNDRNWLAKLMKSIGFGCYNNKAKGFLESAYSGLNLRTCTADELEKIHSIGMKTSRCFIMHSRKDTRHAGLDVHVLKWLRDQGFNVPKQTPSSKKKYIEIEKMFIELASRAGMPVADFDLKIWRQYSGNEVKL